MYRKRPSAAHGAFVRVDDGQWLTGPFNDCETPANRLRWNPWPMPAKEADFFESIVSVAGNGDVHAQTGVAVHVYGASRSMTDRYFMNSDGEMLIVPQVGRLQLHTELGLIELSPGEIGLVPRGMRLRVALPDGEARGYICENYGSPFRLPELGPIGSNGLACRGRCDRASDHHQ
jgi:homogentisate 1,2-dioxygenase